MYREMNKHTRTTDEMKINISYSPTRNIVKAVYFLLTEIYIHLNNFLSTNLSGTARISK